MAHTSQRTTTKYTLLIFSILALLSSCSKQEGQQTVQRVGATFTSGISSRAYDRTWEQGDQVGIYMVNYDQTTGEATPEQQYCNTLHTIRSTGEAARLSSDSTMYYPIDGSEVGFYAYYPYTDQISEDHKYTINVSDQSVPSRIDFMESSGNTGYSKTSSEVSLVFVHSMAMLSFDISMGTGMENEVVEDITVSISGIPTVADYDFATNEFQDLRESSTSFAPYTLSEGKSYNAILFPMTLPEGATVTFHTSVGPLDWDVEGLDLHFGQNYSCPVTLNRTEAAISGVTTIVGWVDTDIDNSYFVAE